MRSSILLAAGAAAFSLGAGFAAAQSQDNPPTTTIMCLDVSGNSLPASCKSQASRLDPREDTCLCPTGAERVTVPICPAGVRPPAESAALERARSKAVSHGSLVGATFEGKPMCREARNVHP